MLEPDIPFHLHILASDIPSQYLFLWLYTGNETKRGPTLSHSLLDLTFLYVAAVGENVCGCLVVHTCFCC